MIYLLSGSLAYDTILSHSGAFHQRIMPNQISKLNVAFGIHGVQEEFGGTAGNIAYNAALLGQAPILCASVGRDFERYASHLEAQGIDTKSLNWVEGENTAHAWILTDKDNNQITSFHAGAMTHRPHLPAVVPPICHLSPDSVSNTVWLAGSVDNYYFDPGQATPAFLEAGLLGDVASSAVGIFVNEYEFELMKTVVSTEELLCGKTEFIIQTLGSKGLYVHTKMGSTHIDVATPERVVDPTGCGDALRAGFLYGMTNGWCIIRSAQLGAVMGSFAVECSGGQNHKPTTKNIMTRLSANYPKNTIKPIM